MYNYKYCKIPYLSLNINVQLSKKANSELFYDLKIFAVFIHLFDDLKRESLLPFALVHLHDVLVYRIENDRAVASQRGHLGDEIPKTKIYLLFLALIHP